MTIRSSTIVYINAPAGLATGGPELLHQLAHALRLNGINAVMHYIPHGLPDPVHSAYQGYEVPFTEEIIDDVQHVMIFPEIFVRSLDDYKHIQKVVWWREKLRR